MELGVGNKKAPTMALFLHDSTVWTKKDVLDQGKVVDGWDRTPSLAGEPPKQTQGLFHACFTHYPTRF